MSDLNIILISVFVAAAALLLVSTINAQQTRRRLINQKVHKLKRKVSELEEVAISLEGLCGNVDVERVVLNEMLDILRVMLSLAPNSQSINLQIEGTLTRREKINAPNYSCQLNRLLDSDAQIAKAQFFLKEAGIIVKKQQAAGKIEHAQMNAYILDLTNAYTMISTISFIGHGHVAIKRGDIFKAHAFYKKAQESVMALQQQDQQRDQIIKELNEILTNKRKSLSVSLMPETRLNPDSAAM